MYPDGLFQELLRGYQPGHEHGEEHNRNGTFIGGFGKIQQGTAYETSKLTFLDPDPMMASDVRRYIEIAQAFDEDMERIIKLKDALCFKEGGGQTQQE